MPKSDIVKRIDQQRTLVTQAALGTLPPIQAVTDIEQYLEIVQDELRLRLASALYTGRRTGGHVGLFAGPSRQAWLEATDVTNVPFLSAGVDPTQAADHWLRIGYPDQPGIALVDVVGYPTKQVRIAAECIEGTVESAAGTIIYNYIIHEGGTCKAVNGLTGKTEMDDADYAAVVQYALDHAGPDSSIIFRPGIYTFDRPVIPNQRQALWVTPGVRFKPAGDNSVFDMSHRDRIAVYGTLYIEDDAAHTVTAPAIIMEDMALCYYERIVIINAFRGIDLSGETGGTHENYFGDIYMQVRDRGINLTFSCHDNHFNHVWIKGPAPDNWATGPGLRIATGGTQGGNSFSQIEILDMYWGMDLPGAYEVWFGNVIVDNAYGTCIWMSGMAEHLFFDTIWTASSGDGLHIEGNPSVLPITYADKIHINKLYTWLNANWGLRLSGYIKGLTINQVTAQRNAKGVGFENVENNNIVIDTLYTLENTEWGLNGLNAGSGVIVRSAMMEDTLLNPDTFMVLGGFTSVGKFYAKGVATILNEQASVVVTHGLDTTPAIVLLGPQDAEVAGAYVPTRTATTFTISVDAAVTADRTVAWSAYSRANSS